MASHNVLQKDDNGYPVMGGISSADSTQVKNSVIDSVTGRLYTDNGGGANLIVGTSLISSGTTTRVLYDNAGVVGEYPITGSGSVVLGTNPTIAKPILNATNPTAQTYSPAGGGTATLDLSLANQHYVTFPAGNITLALTNDTSNQAFVVSLTQDSGGSRTVTWFATVRWAGGVTPTLTTTGSKRDTFGFIRTGSGTYDGFIVGQNI